jgi:hypothetical protein
MAFYDLEHLAKRNSGIVIDLVDSEKRPVHWYMDIDIPPRTLWAFFADFRGIGEWWPDQGTKFDFIGDGIGMIRNIYPKEPPMLSQRLEAINDAAMIVESTFLNCRDFGMLSFRGSMGVKPLANGWSRLTYTAIAEVLESEDHEEHVDAVEAYLEGFYLSMKAQLESRGIASGAATGNVLSFDE